MPHYTLDARGLKCPLPVLKARRALDGLQTGDLLTVTATDPAAERDFPEFCDAAGHGIDSVDIAPDGSIIVRITKGPLPIRQNAHMPARQD